MKLSTIFKWTVKVVLAGLTLWSFTESLVLGVCIGAMIGALGFGYRVIRASINDGELTRLDTLDQFKALPRIACPTLFNGGFKLPKIELPKSHKKLMEEIDKAEKPEEKTTLPLKEKTEKRAETRDSSQEMTARLRSDPTVSPQGKAVSPSEGSHEQRVREASDDHGKMVEDWYYTSQLQETVSWKRQLARRKFDLVAQMGELAKDEHAVLRKTSQVVDMVEKNNTLRNQLEARVQANKPLSMIIGKGVAIAQVADQSKPAPARPINHHPVQVAELITAN